MVDAMLACMDVDRNEADDCGWTLLFMAAWQGHKEVIDALACEDVDRDKGKMCAAALCCNQWPQGVFDILLACKDVGRNKAGFAGQTALHSTLLPVLRCLWKDVTH